MRKNSQLTNQTAMTSADASNLISPLLDVDLPNLSPLLLLNLGYPNN